MSQALPAVDVIIVNWNTGDRLRDCLAALSATQQKSFLFGRVVIVDNASADRSADDLDFPDLPLVVIRNGTNRGFAAASNQGASGSSPDYVLFLNPDTRVFDDTLDTSVKWMEQPEHSRVGVLGIKLFDENQEVARSCTRFVATRYFLNQMFGLSRLFPKTFPGHLYAEWDHLESRPIEHVIGAYFFVRNSVFRAMQGFDERFFLYYEDVDFTFRASHAGWSCYYLASTQCLHEGGGSTKQIKARRLFYSLRSRIYYGFKHFTLPNAVFLLLATFFIEPVTRCAQAILQGSLKQTGEVAHAYLMLWGELPRILGSSYLLKPETLKLDLEHSG